MQEWQQGNAARQPQYDEIPNPFTPVDYAARLKTTPRNAPGANVPPAAGQPYTWQPPVYSPPPMAAPVQEIPAYMQPPQQAEPLMPGAPYGVNAYQNGPVPMVQAFAHPAEDPPLQPDELKEPLRDAFMPATDPKPLKKIPEDAQLPQRAPVRVGRVVALTAAIMMLVFCSIAIVRIALTVDRDGRSMQQAQNSFREENGIELQYAAARVDLLPKGQTFEPTNPPVIAQTPTVRPTPVIQFNEAAVLAMAGEQMLPEGEEPTAAPPLRSKLTSYPKNPLCNIQDSLKELIAINPEVVGRLVIPGLLDEVVVQRNNTFYLTHSYTGANSDAGSVFVDESCSIRMPPENLLLRAQSSVGGKAFARLWQFVNGGTGFASANATVQLTTLYEDEPYVLFAVILANNDPKAAGAFHYASHPTFATDDAMMSYVQSARAQSLYAFNVDVNAQDRLLTLATLGSGDQSVVLMYRMARDGENY